MNLAFAGQMPARLNLGLERTNQFFFVLQRRLFGRAKLEFDPANLIHQPQVAARHPVGICNPVMVETLFEVLRLANVEGFVLRVFHQIHARAVRSSAKELLPQPLVKRSRIRNEVASGPCWLVS